MKKLIWAILIVIMTSSPIFANCYDLENYEFPGTFGKTYHIDTIEQLNCISAETRRDAYNQAWEKYEGLSDVETYKQFHADIANEACPENPVIYVLTGDPDGYFDLYIKDLWLYFAKKCCVDVDDDGNCDDEDDCECDDNKECADPWAGDPINVLSGNHVEKETDLEFNTPFEQGFKFSRIYQSKYTEDSTIGYGWTPNYLVILKPYETGAGYRYVISDESRHIHQFIDTDDDGRYTPKFATTNGYLVAELDGSFTWHKETGIKYRFNAQYQMIAKEDSKGSIQSFSYDQGRLDSITDQATGRFMGFEYNADGKIDHIEGPVTQAVSDGIWVRYQYENNNLTQVEYADKNNGSTASGFIYKYEDPNGDEHNLTSKYNLANEFLASWQYDGADRAWENNTRDGKGATIQYYSDSVVVTDQQGTEKTYNIDTVNGKRKVTSVNGDGGCGSCGGDVVGYEYDDQHRVIEKKMTNGRIDQYKDYDENDRHLTEILAVGTVNERTIRYTLHPETGQQLTITEASVLGSGDKETIFDYDDDGNATPNENPTRLMYRKIERGFTFDAAEAVVSYEHITVYTYNPNGQVLTVDGPLPGDQDKIIYTYYPVTGDLHTETRPLVGTTTYDYDDAGNVTSITDVNNVVSTIGHDGRNRQLSTTRNGVTTSRTYTAAGELDTATDALGRTMDYTYNTAGFMEKIIDPSGNFMYYGYNALGQRDQETIHAADTTQTFFRGTDYGDPATNPDLPSGKPWKSVRRNHGDTADLETTYTYDSSGNLKSVTDAKSNVTTYHYDLFNRLYQVIQPGDVTTTYTYDAHGNLDTVTDAEGHVTIYTYDDLGRRVNTDSPDTGITRYSYDEAGNLRFKVQNNNTIEYRYDLLGRLENILYSDATQNVIMTYDSGAGANLMGRLATVTDPSGFVEYSYDADGSVTMETRTVNGVAFVTGYSYDDAGNLSTITYPTGHTITYQPDMTDPALIGGVVLDGSQTMVSNITYAPFGPVKTMTLGNGIQTAKTYDKNYQLSTLVAGTAMDRTYTPDDMGNVDIITDNLDANRSQSFGYGDLYRLNNANGIYGTVDFTYDKVGNRLTRTQTGATPSQDTYHYYPDTNRLHAVVGTSAELIEYDADGNTTVRISAAVNPVPPITDPADYTYNSSGQRSIKDATGDKIFHYDLSGQLIAETDGLGNLIKAYVWLHGQPLAQIVAGGGVYYYHNDHLGTPQKMTDSNGNVVWAADYLPFGQADVIVETIENNLRFAGQYYDSETGLHYNYFRFYDPLLGRYLRADPIGLKGGINPYTYVSNNPLTKIDSLGLSENNNCAYCPDGKWDVDHGFTASAVIGFGATASDITFTCLSNNKKCKGKLYCGVAGVLADIGVGWVVDFQSLGGGRTISGKYNKSDVQDYTVSGPVLIAPLKVVSAGASGNSVTIGIGISAGMGYAWCYADYVFCDN